MKTSQSEWNKSLNSIWQRRQFNALRFTSQWDDNWENNWDIVWNLNMNRYVKTHSRDVAWLAYSLCRIR